MRTLLSSRTPRAALLAATAFAAVTLVACGPQPTPVEPTPAPEDEPAPQASVEQHTELRDAINAPLDQARTVEDTLKQSADAQAAAIEAAEGAAGDTPPQ